MPAEFIKCSFSRHDKREYTYRNPGFTVAAGDVVKVPDNRADGWKRATVTAINVPEPTAFKCKDILGLVDDQAGDLV